MVRMLAGVIVEILEAAGSTVAAEQLIARIDTEAVAGAVAAPAAVAAAAPAACGCRAVAPRRCAHRTAPAPGPRCWCEIP